MRLPMGLNVLIEVQVLAYPLRSVAQARIQLWPRNTPMDRFRNIETFVRVVQTGSFSLAAKQLGLSRSVVTKHVLELERHVGARLLNRTTRSIALTEMGSAYFRFSVRFMRELENEEHFITRLQRESEGALKISAPKSFGSFLFADAVAEFASLHPDINISLTLDDSSSLHSKSIEYEFDVAIRLMHIEDSTAITRRIGGIDWIACASPDYILQQGAPQQPEDLRKANCLVHPKLANDNLWRFVSGNKIISVKVGGTFSSNSVVVLRRAVIRGIGIALLPLYRVKRDLASGELVQVLKDFPLQERPLYVLLPDNRLMPEKVRIFIDFLARWYRLNSDNFRLTNVDACEAEHTAVSSI